MYFSLKIGNARPKRLYFVSFYGSTADFAWVSDAAMISYQGVEAFTKYAQEAVDKVTFLWFNCSSYEVILFHDVNQAQTKSQKEQLTERFQLKVTIGRREDWESAVREADGALKKLGDARVREIESKIESYTKRSGKVLMRYQFKKKMTIVPHSIILQLRQAKVNQVAVQNRRLQKQKKRQRPVSFRQ